MICRERPEWHADWQSDQSRDRVGNAALSWRWVSYADTGRRIRQWWERLADLPAGTRVGVEGSPSVEAVAVDLAVRWAGLRSVPLIRAQAVAGVGGDVGGGGEAESARPAVSVLVDTRSSSADRPAAGDSGPAELRALSPVDGSEKGMSDDPLSPASREVGGCSVVTAGGQSGDLEGQSLLAAAERLAAILGKSRKRDVVIHGRSLADISERVVIEWAIRSGGAIVVVPVVGLPGAAIGEAAFRLRPTVLHGRADELRNWASLFRAGEGRPAGLGARFKKLRWIVVTGAEALDVETSSFYLRLGAAVVGLENSGVVDFDPL